MATVYSLLRLGAAAVMLAFILDSAIAHRHVLIAVAVPEVITQQGDIVVWGNNDDVIQKGVATEHQENRPAISPAQNSPSIDNSATPSSSNEH